MTDRIISGPGTPSLNTPLNYTVSTAGLDDAGVWFQWEISGGVVGHGADLWMEGLQESPVSLTFYNRKKYTLTLNFNKSGHTLHSISTTIDLRPPLTTPVISGSMFGGLCRFTVTNPQNDVTYEWEVDGKLTALTGPQITVIPNGEIITPHSVPTLVSSKSARCRATRDEVKTAWSNMAIVTF